MAVLNAVKREIVAKIVFYGPGLSGKTANLQKIHETMDPQNVGELTSLATESDRTLFFDFVPIQLGSIAGLNTRFQLFTVPGQVFYNQTRRTVLENTDGIVFVADSQPEQLENNLESMRNLEENLGFYGKKMTEVPFVIQFNKQDIPGCMTEEELNKLLNRHNVPSLKASCVEGFGVMETLAKISTMVLSHLREQMTRKGPSPSGAPGIKRTYSKEGVSDDMVVKNLLEDIAASGGVQEAQAAGDIKAPAGAAPPPPRQPMPSRASVSGAPIARPAGTPPPPISPKSAPRPIVPAATPTNSPSGGGMSAEELLFDVESSVPAKKISPVPPPPPRNPPRTEAPGPIGKTPAPPSARSSSAPKVINPVGPPPPPTAARIANAPPPLPPTPGRNGTPAGLKATPAAPPAATLTNGGKTAEELLESLEKEERSIGPSIGAMTQEGPGSFKGGLWDDDEGEGTPSQEKPANPFADDAAGNKTSLSAGPAKIPAPSSMPARPVTPAKSNPFGEDEIGNRTSISLHPPSRSSPAGLEPSRPAPAALAPVESRFGDGDGDARVVSVSQPVSAGNGIFTVEMMIEHGGRRMPVVLNLGVSDLAAVMPKSAPAPAPARSSGLVTALVIVNFLGLLAIAAYLVAMRFA